MKEWEELRNGKKVTVIEKGEEDLSPGDRMLARLAALEADMLKIKQALNLK